MSTLSKEGNAASESITLPILKAQICSAEPGPECSKNTPCGLK